MCIWRKYARGGRGVGGLHRCPYGGTDARPNTGTPAETKDESTSAATTDHDDQNKTSTIFNLKVGLGVVSTLLAVAILYVARTTHAARQARREAALGKATAVDRDDASGVRLWMRLLSRASS